MVKRKDIIAKARSWIGIEYRFRGRSRQGIDCSGLVVGVAKELKLFDYDFTNYVLNDPHVIEQHILKSGNQDPLTESFLFASAVTEFGLILRDSEYKGISSLERVLEMAMASKGEDQYGYRIEFIELVQKTIQIKNGAGEVRNE